MKKIRFLFVLGIVLLYINSIKAEASEMISYSEIVDTSNHIYSYNEMTVDIALLQENYPKCVSYNSLGLSVDNRNIWNVIVGNPNAPKAIYVQAAIHGREWMNTWIVMKQVEEICKIYDENLFNQICIYIVPMVNPDGVCISQYGIESITNSELKEKLYKMSGANKPSLWKANANGVDLNRNFSVGWGTGNIRKNPCSENYLGPTAFSEPEVIAVVNLFKSRKFEIGISYHSMEGAIYWNVGQTDSLYTKTALLASEISNITGYKLGKKAIAHGLDYNWMIFDQQTPSVIIETGTVKCPLPYSQWAELWNRNGALILQLACLYSKDVAVIEPVEIKTNVMQSMDAATLPIVEPAVDEKIIVIDPGHQIRANLGKEPIGPGATVTKTKVSGGTSGVVSGLKEYELTLMVSEKLKTELESRGYTVIMTRTSHDVDISNSERAAIANENNALAFVRIHANGSVNKNANGAMTICQTKNNPYNGNLYNDSRLLSDAVLNELVTATGCRKEYVWETDTMSGVNWCTVPVSIIEMGYMTNANEDRLMATEEYQNKIAMGIANGIDLYINQTADKVIEE